ncbi:MAG TPA: hypothetical protein VGP24_11470, partial [Glaciihabitans sp.]|nr:hypothetical protein [Glaciihabitans sp.]
MRETHPSHQRRRVGVGLSAGIAALALVVGSPASATAAEPLVAPTLANPSFESGLDGWTSTGAFGSATTE